MTGKLSKNFHGVGIGPLSKILAVKSLKRKLSQDPQDHPEERFSRGQFLKSLEMKDPQDPHNPKDHQDQ